MQNKPSTAIAVRLRQISRSDVEQRWYELARTNYLTVVSVAKGFVATTAAFVLLQILTTDSTPLQLVSNMMLWIAAMIGMVMTYQANSLGTVVMFWMPTYRDVLPSFLVGIIEFCLFALLIMPHSSISVSERSPYWFGMFAFYAVVGGGVAGYAGNQVRKVDYDPDMKAIMLLYASRQIKHAIFAFCLFLFWIIVAVWLGYVEESSLVTALLPCGAVLNMCITLHIQESDIRWMGRLIRQAEYGGGNRATQEPL